MDFAIVNPESPEIGYSDVGRSLTTSKPDRMSTFFHRFSRAVLRVFPPCLTQTQAIAFNMFLAFFPMLLVVLGIVSSSVPFRLALQGMVARLHPRGAPGTG